MATMYTPCTLQHIEHAGVDEKGTYIEVDNSRRHTNYAVRLVSRVGVDVRACMHATVRACGVGAHC